VALILQAQSVSKSFGPIKLLDGVSPALEPGRVHDRGERRGR
jgi:ABC-type sugar transport system ATPase subunit